MSWTLLSSSSSSLLRTSSLRSSITWDSGTSSRKMPTALNHSVADLSSAPPLERQGARKSTTSRRRPPPLTKTSLQRPPPNKETSLLQKESTSSDIYSLYTKRTFLQVVDENPPDCLLVVMFHAHYCKTCQRMSIPFKQLAKKYADKKTQFARLEATEDFHPDQLRALGVTSFPFVQMFRGSDCVASFKGGGPFFRRTTEDTVLDCLKRTEDEWQAFGGEHAEYMADHASALAKLSEHMIRP